MRRWGLGLFGFLLAGAGGLLEIRHQVALGVVMVVIGLGTGALTAGARLMDGVAIAAVRQAHVRGRAPRPLEPGKRRRGLRRRG